MLHQPMLARAGRREDLDREGFIFEPKLDGIRALGLKRDGLRFLNRSGRDVSDRYPEFTFADALKAGSCVVDGEIVLYDAGGNPDFSQLMKRHLGTATIRTHDRALRYAVFDLLEIDGRDLTRLPLIERKEMLAEVVAPHPHLELTFFTLNGRGLWEIITGRGVEGVIAKKASSPYRPGRRSADWRKIKAFETLDAVIVGFTSDRRAVSALALAVCSDDGLRFVGKVGTGFTSSEMNRLRRLLEADQVDSPPVDAPPEYRDVVWVEPKYVCEIRYLEFGSQGMVRNPSFLRLRPDKYPEICRLDTQPG